MKKVAIIGAGPAGLAAAYELTVKSKDFSVKIYEKDNNVGGLSKSFDFSGGTVDIGGHRYFTKDKKVEDIWNTILPYDEKGMLTRKRKSHILYKNNLIEYPIKFDMSTIKNIGIPEGIKIFASYLFQLSHKNEIKSLEDFYIMRFGKELYKIFFEQYTYKLWGRPASDLSADWGAQRIQRLSVKTIISNFYKNSEERTYVDKFIYPAQGSGQFWNALSEKLISSGVEIHTGCKINILNNDEKNIKEIEYLRENVKYNENFDYVISSMPLRELILSLRCCDEKIRDTAKRLSYRDMLITAIEIDKCFAGTLLKDNSEDCWFYVQDKNIHFGRVQLINNWSMELVNNRNSIVIELEYFCKEDDKIYSVPDKELIDCAVQELIYAGFFKKNTVIKSYFIKKIEKAYPVYADGYYKLDSIKNYTDKFENLFIVGRNGQHRYNNMDHSMLSGIEAADSIIFKRTDKGNIWDVNNGSEYIEKT